MKQLSIIFLINLIYLESKSFQTNWTDKIICFSPSSTVKMFASSLRSDLLARSHEMAFKENKVEIRERFEAKNDVDLISKAENAFLKGCKILLGMYTSKECLLTAPIAKKYNSVIITPTCGHVEIESYKGHIYSLVPSISDYMDQISKFIHKKRWGRTSPVFVFFQPTDVFSSLSYGLFIKNYKKEIIAIRVDKEGEIYNEDLELAKIPHQVNLVLSYPVIGGKILESINKISGIKPDSVLIAASSWAFDLSAISKYKEVIGSFSEAYLPEITPHYKIKRTSFYKNYLNSFKEKPLGIHAVGYDATNIAIRCSKVWNAESKISSFHSCMKNREHSGVLGKYSFSNESVFVNRHIYFSNLKEVVNRL